MTAPTPTACTRCTFIDRVNIATTVDDLRAVVNDICQPAAKLTDTDLKMIAECIASRRILMMIEGHKAA